MASELQFDAGPGLAGITAYAMLRNSAALIWNTVGAVFEVFAAGSIADYDLALVEQGATGYYVGDMPVVAAGLYTLTIKQRAGASPAVADTRIGGGEGDWNGTAWQTVANISSRLPTALVSGRVDASVGAMAANVVTAAAIADNAIDTATFAAGTTIPRCTLVDTLTTYTGNTVQTGDSFARLGAAGAGLTAIPWNAAWDAEVQSECDDAIAARFTFTVVGQCDANIQYVNDVQVAGTGAVGNRWGPV